MLRAISGLKEVADLFDAFILDLWGLIHDGERLYPPSTETFRKIKASGRKTLLLSNAPRRAHALTDAMTKMGLRRELYGEVLSSGEATRDELIARTDPFFSGLGVNAYHLGPERDRSIFEDTKIQIVGAIEAGDFIVNTGPVELDHSVDVYEDILSTARAKNMPMVCANPDLVVIRGGVPIVCAGAIARKYEALGGQVVYRGKPDPAIYAFAAKRLGITDMTRIAVVGDALETDVKGAAAAGMPSIWCTGGIHAESLQTKYGLPADIRKASSMAAADGHCPIAVIPGFFWE
ncbi:MAG: TIGR01459 family HAD-type hydrolase [Candidatus Marinimicrobia bacterium]|nr:TIGR01459 family HAD-type hydrolase [Candidatus Neomarinimicrobiota bacterium]